MYDANEGSAARIDSLVVKGGALLLSSESKGSPLINVTTTFTLQAPRHPSRGAAHPWSRDRPRDLPPLQEGSQLKLDNLGRVIAQSLQVLSNSQIRSRSTSLTDQIDLTVDQLEVDTLSSIYHASDLRVSDSCVIDGVLYGSDQLQIVGERAIVRIGPLGSVSSHEVRIT